MDTQEVIHWLQDGGELEAADLVSQCVFSYHFIDMGFPLHGGPDIDIFALDIQAPRHILDRISCELKEQTTIIERAIQVLAQTSHCYVRDINWVAKVGHSPMPLDSEIKITLEKLDSERVRLVWRKALSRQEDDPAGAITLAKNLVEAVCKRILNFLGVQYPPFQDIPSLYSLVTKHLNLSPNQHINKNLKKILGNCKAIVNGISFLRNKLGDAHYDESVGVMPTKADAELAINLAGAMATFLIKSWEGKKHETSNKT